jgi:hypothetical protein
MYISSRENHVFWSSFQCHNWVRSPTFQEMGKFEHLKEQICWFTALKVRHHERILHKGLIHWGQQIQPHFQW